jgi:hypothetical protein
LENAENRHSTAANVLVTLLPQMNEAEKQFSIINAASMNQQAQFQNSYASPI